MRQNGCSGKICPAQVGTADNCKLTKEQCPYFTQDIDYQAALQAIRSEVAREIFAEIRKQINGYENIDIILDRIEKKYTEATP